MIDWLDIVVSYAHKECISDGHVYSTAEGGLFEWEVNKSKQVEGSHSSTVKIKTIGLKNDEDDTNTAILISGNPVKFFQGHNLFGTDDVKPLAYQFVLKALEKIGREPTEQLKDFLRRGYYNINRVDCTLNFALDSRADVKAWIRKAVKHASGKHQKTSSYSEQTVYIGQHSRRITTKFYCKGDEFAAHKLPETIPHEIGIKLSEYANSLLRCEVTLRRKILKERNLDMGLHWFKPNQVREIVLERIKAFRLPENVFLGSSVISNLQPRLQLAYDGWKTGKDLRGLFTRPTFYRYRKELLPHGIDISCASGKEQTEFEIPLKSFLERPPVEVPEWAKNTEYYYEPLPLPTLNNV